MSGVVGGSRLTNENNSVNSSTAGISGSGETREIPTPGERISEFHEEYPELAALPLTREDGRRLRAELVENVREEWIVGGEKEWENGFEVSATSPGAPLTWGAAVEELLESHEETRRTALNLEKGRSDEPGYETWTVDAEDRWMAAYQRRYFAEMNGWLRELCGGERPSGGETEPDYENAHVVLLTRTASARPEGWQIAPTDHEAALRDSWEPVYHTLRNTMRALGFEIGEGWQYDRRSEPHAGLRGGGVNHCYGHEHIVIVVDGEVSPGDFKPVLEKHVEVCDLAGEDAHTVEDGIEIKEAEEMENLAAYVADYCGIEPKDLLERDIEYVAWAGIKHATNARTLSRSDAAGHAATADACKQRFESPQSDQDVDHGESVIRSTKRGCEFECACCGSPHGIEQDHETLTAARLSEGGSGEAVAADGGIDRKAELAQRWESARAAASVGETPTVRERRERIEEYLETHPGASVAEVLGALGLPERCKRLVVEVCMGVDRSEAVGFERPPRWRLRSVTVGEQEYPASAGGGVDMVSVDLPLQRLRSTVDVEDRRFRCECGVVAYGDTMLKHLKAVHGITSGGLASVVIVEERVAYLV